MAHFNKLNILIFEEYLFLSSTLAKMLKTLGMGTVCKTNTLSEAQKALMGESVGNAFMEFDFAIIDLTPPNNHGLSLLHWLRNHQNTHLKYLPVIFTTNDSREKIILAGRDSGAHEILVKPYTANNVSRRIINLINRPRPFVQSSQYTGPDRRRRSETFSGNEKRLTSIKDIEIIDERISA